MAVLDVIEISIQGSLGLVLFNVFRSLFFLVLGLVEVFGSHVPLFNTRTFGAMLIPSGILYGVINFILLKGLIKVKTVGFLIRWVTVIPFLLPTLLINGFILMERKESLSDAEWNLIGYLIFFGVLEMGMCLAFADFHRCWNRFLRYEQVPPV